MPTRYAGLCPQYVVAGTYAVRGERRPCHGTRIGAWCVRQAIGCLPLADGHHYGAGQSQLLVSRNLQYWSHGGREHIERMVTGQDALQWRNNFHYLL
jgi:hypothetical protein